jgi:hypothetical protein
MLEASENVIQPESQPINSTQIALTFVDNFVAMDISPSEILEVVITEIQIPSSINPPLILTSNLVLQGVCQVIFDSLQDLLEARHHAIHLVNHANKWNNLRKLVNRTLDNLQTVEIASRQEAL